MNEIQVGDRVRGRDVTGQHQTEGVVLAVRYPRDLGIFQDDPNDRPHWERRYRIDTGKTYPTGGKLVSIVECAELLAE